jgi:hypothetical protein
MSRPNNYKYHLLNRDVPFILDLTLYHTAGKHSATNEEFNTVITLLKGRLLHNIAFPKTNLNDEELCVLSDILNWKVHNCELQICQ